MMAHKALTALLALLLLFPAGDLHGQSLHLIRGVVYDETSSPLPGANIYLPELDLGAVSQSDGSFKIGHVPAGRFVIHISFVGYETEILNIQLPGNSKELKIRLHASHVSGKEVVISGGRHTSQHKNSVKIELIDTQQIHQSAMNGVIESLSIIPGVDMITNGGGVSTPVIRGLSTTNILVVNNGVRMENYQFSENHPYLLDASGISQVEIIKGPASMLYGSDAIGGIIHVVDDYKVEPGSISGEAGLKYLGNPRGYNSYLGVHGNQGMLSWSLHAASRGAADYRDGDGRQVVNSRYGGHSLKTSAGLRFDQSLHRLRYEYQKFKPALVNPASQLLVLDDERKQEYWYQNLDSHLASLTNAWYLNKLKLRANASYQKNLRRLITDEPDHKAVDMALRTITYETRATLLGSKSTEFDFSIQGLNQQNRNGDGENRILPDYHYNDLGFFALVQHDFENELHLQAGLRFDNRFLDVPTQEKTGHSHEETEEGHEEEELMEGFQRYYGNVSASIGATYELAEGILLRGHLATAYRAPSVAELTQDGEHGTRYEQGDPDLLSQRSYEVDLSFHYHREKILVDIAGYYNQIQRYIFLGPTADTTDEGHEIYRYMQNDAHLYGLEAMVEILPIRNLELRLAYNYTRGIQAGDENLPLMPHDKLLSELEYSIPHILRKGRVFVKAGADYAFAQDHYAVNETLTPSWFLLHAGAGFQIPMGHHQLSFSVQVRNLLDISYVDHLSALKSMDYLNMGRSVVLSLSVPFCLHHSAE